MPVDKKRHRRRSIRLPGHDYRAPGAYFVTICVQGGESLFGEVVDGAMRLSAFGHVSSYYWEWIPDHASHVELDAWVVTPNHVHGIIVITGESKASPVQSSSARTLTAGGTRPPG